MVSAVVVNFNSGTYLERCVRALAGQPEVDEITIVDNASEDGSLERAEAAALHRVRVIRNATNVGPSTARNQGAAASRGDILLFVDADVALPPGAAARLASSLTARPGVSAPALFVEALGKIEYGSTIDLVGYPVSIDRDRPSLFVSSSALATNRGVYDRVGRFDQRYFFGSEESDFCWRVLLAGYEVTVLTDVVAQHGGGVSVAGGYVRRGQVQTTAFRLVNRERNTLACLMKCAPVTWLLVMIPAHVLYVTATSAVVLMMGKPAVAAALMQGIAWNVRELPETLRLRRRIPRTRLTAARAAARIELGVIPLRMLRARGLPRFVDTDSRANHPR